ncbi:MAG: hypothetical protein ACI9OJ_005557 [Myxococcota bacterium]|jgi:hypothetical protein
MTNERIYGEAEIAQILEEATKDRDPTGIAPSTSGGLTLHQLQDIGQEVGIDADRIAQAATSLAHRAEAGDPVLYLGAPRSVQPTVHLDRAPTDREWARLVADLRETFDAPGKIESLDDLRSWTNGNLQVHVEPSGDAYRVRMRTVKGDVSPLNDMGLGLLAVSLRMLVLWLVGGESLGILAAASGAVGAAVLGYNRARLPGWAATRAAQMDELADRIPLLLDDPSTQDD